ncbi:VanZ family protein [Clostridium sp.]|uniref:VanZ family protein n=1 Tax=Clostridium sp. TaxID=1506 RepID=UPI00261C6FA1|nr:VanZ family protein [Clostridium sp.]
MVKLVDVIISIILGIILNYFVTSEIIAYLFQGLDSIYNIVGVIAIIIQVLFIFIVIQLIRSKQIDKKSYVSLWTLYWIVMLLLLFGRRQSEVSVNFNILYLFERDSFMQNIMNIIFFIPIGYLLYIKKIKRKNMLLIGFSGVILIELIQMVLYIGIFDICDIVLNVLGICIGYFICNKYKFKITTG